MASALVLVPQETEAAPGLVDWWAGLCKGKWLRFLDGKYMTIVHHKFYAFLTL